MRACGAYIISVALPLMSTIAVVASQLMPEGKSSYVITVNASHEEWSSVTDGHVLTSGS